MDARDLLDGALSRAADACGLRVGMDYGYALADLCRRAGDALDAPECDDAQRRIAALSPDELGQVLRYVTARFHLLNQAEQVQIIRVNRQRARDATPGQPRAESLQDAMARLRELGVSPATLRGLIGRLDVQPTLTAHPTEAKRRSVMNNLVRIANELQTLHDARATPAESAAAERRVGELVQILLATDDVRVKRLEVIDEVKNGLFFLTSSIWRAVPRLVRELADSADQTFGRGTLDAGDIPAVLRYRTWIGGDRDGNPRVTHDVTVRTMAMLREAVAELWDRELLDLQLELTLSSRQVPLPEWFVSIVEADGRKHLDDAVSLEQRRYEPVRVRLMQMRGRIARDPSYDGAGLLRDLLDIRRAIAEAGLPEVASSGSLVDAIVRARVFGLHLATLDIRQHSRVHETAVAELLAVAGVTSNYAALSEDEKTAILRAELAQPRPLRPVDAPLSAEAGELMQTLHAVRQAVTLDRRRVRSFIISMTHGVSDILEVLLLMKEAGLSRVGRDTTGRVRLESTLHIVPLLETIDDLERAEPLVSAMLDEPLYRSHLDSLIPADLPKGSPEARPVQEIMLGYSDSNKDGGFLMANLALDHAQRRIAAAVCSRGLLLRFFHGRGGTVGRGGGRAGRAILAAPPAARTGRIRFTEQGEVISFRYAMTAIAERHLEQIMHASLVSAADDREPDRPTQWHALIERLAKISERRYRSLIDDPDFWSWYVGVGPIGPIGGLPIASRPVMRAAGSGVGAVQTTFDQLRAIPWVFTWVQMRCLAPGWFGLGTALSGLSEAEMEMLAAEYRHGAWLATVIDNAAQELLRTRLPIARRYALAGVRAGVAPAANQRIFGMLAEEHESATRGVLRISGRRALGDESPIIAQSIRERNPWTDVLNLVQIELLSRRRASGEAEHPVLDQLLLQSVSAIAAAMQSTG